MLSDPSFHVLRVFMKELGFCLGRAAKAAERTCKTELEFVRAVKPSSPTPSNHSGEECEYYVTPSYHRFTSNRFN